MTVHNPKKLRNRIGRSRNMRLCIAIVRLQALICLLDHSLPTSASKIIKVANTQQFHPLIQHCRFSRSPLKHIGLYLKSLQTQLSSKRISLALCIMYNMAATPRWTGGRRVQKCSEDWFSNMALHDRKLFLSLFSAKLSHRCERGKKKSESGKCTGRI